MEGRLPLHAAASAKGHQNLKIAKFVVREWPEALHEPDNQGNWPLHAALSGLAPADVVRFLALECPASLQPRNHDGTLPLDLALAHVSKALSPHFRAQQEDTCEDLYGGWLREARQWRLVELDDSPLGTVRWLVEQRPESLQALDAEGRVPLHVAAALNPGLVPTLPLVRFFVATWPGAAEVRDRRGLLPFQSAAVVDAPLDVVYYLTRLRPGGQQEAGQSAGSPRRKKTRAGP